MDIVPLLLSTILLREKTHPIVSPEKCTIPTLHYATTSPVAGTVVANGTGVVVLCKSGYVFDKTDAFTTSICNIDTNKLPDCHSKLYIKSGNDQVQVFWTVEKFAKFHVRHAMLSRKQEWKNTGKHQINY